MHPRAVDPREWTKALTSYKDARRIALSNVSRLPPVRVPLSLAIGLTAFEDVDAQIDVPPFGNSAMDGFAVAFDDLDEVGHVPAALVHRVSTGMPLPGSTDTVIPWEQTTSDEGGLTVDPTSARRGQFVRLPGHDICEGQRLLSIGTTLGPVDLAVLAATGIEDLEVIPRPRVGVLIAGDELVSPGGPRQDYQIFDVNSTLLPALLERAGAAHVTVTVSTDDERQISTHLESLAADHDLLITTGGASVGERDWTRTVIESLGTVAVWRVAVRPGKPVLAGTVFDTPILGLPGNPGSVLACTHAFVAPTIRSMAGRPTDPVTVRATLTDTIVNAQARTFLCPVGLDGARARPLIGASSQSLLHAASIDGFTVVPPSTDIAAGSSVTVEVMA